MVDYSHEIEFKVYKGNKLLYKGKQKGHSYLRNWLNLIRAHFIKGREVAVKEDGTTVRLGYTAGWCDSYASVNIYGFYMTAGANDDSYGLVVGYGTTPPSPEDYKLEKKYPHGSGLGYLKYDSTKVGNVALEGNKLIVPVERAFYNDCESPQDITEVGLMVYYNAYSSGVVDNRGKFLIMRDVLDTALTVPAYATAVVRYNIYFIVG